MIGCILHFLPDTPHTKGIKNPKMVLLYISKLYHFFAKKNMERKNKVLFSRVDGPVQLIWPLQHNYSSRNLPLLSLSYRPPRKNTQMCRKIPQKTTSIGFEMHRMYWTHSLPYELWELKKVYKENISFVENTKSQKFHSCHFFLDFFDPYFHTLFLWSNSQNPHHFKKSSCFPKKYRVEKIKYYFHGSTVHTIALVDWCLISTDTKMSKRIKRMTILKTYWNPRQQQLNYVLKFRENACITIQQ